MANKQNDRRLFDYIHSIGDVYNYKDSLCINDNRGPNARNDSHYQCFLKGGILFDISREREAGGWEYYVDIHWNGPFEATDSTDIIATLLWLHHELPKVD